MPRCGSYEFQSPIARGRRRNPDCPDWSVDEAEAFQSPIARGRRRNHELSALQRWASKARWLFQSPIARGRRRNVGYAPSDAFAAAVSIPYSPGQATQPLVGQRSGNCKNEFQSPIARGRRRNTRASVPTYKEMFVSIPYSPGQATQHEPGSRLARHPDRERPYRRFNPL